MQESRTGKIRRAGRTCKTVQGGCGARRTRAGKTCRISRTGWISRTSEDKDGMQDKEGREEM